MCKAFYLKQGVLLGIVFILANLSRAPAIAATCSPNLPVPTTQLRAVIQDEGKTARKQLASNLESFHLDVGEIIHSGGNVFWSYPVTGQQSADGPLHFVVTVTYCNDQGKAINAHKFEVTFNNISPNATFSSDKTTVQIDEPVTLLFSSVFDPSPADVAAGFTYAYDCDDADGTQGLDVLSNQTTYPCPPYGRSGVFRVMGRITDKDGGFTTYEQFIEVQVPPNPCVPNPEADLRGSLPARTEGVVVNNSIACSYEVGIASYKRFDDILENQQLFDSNTATVGPGETLNLTVIVPECALQVDLFYGEVLLSFDGQRYGERLLANRVSENLPFCTPPDSDGDGATDELDCAPQDSTIYPNAPEIADDGIDQDCDGMDLIHPPPEVELPPIEPESTEIPSG